ncbi:DNA mismatch repair endonuclease MutL [Clostridiaceae bacterium NSJ-31]|uniref:DNA mismatch repair protein MutL n=1 Tax=Ligaoa zhengdingensis TaxID=2763658 RepID=A0A926DU97_9FIRM|nr:DNA mismatch repair endonuclease MutL [Ligaoa zhengdingensis]MBC8545395.1 DNA mismatch repair endonuclease MutL [Ligaoa zhengdingensis]
MGVIHRLDRHVAELIAAGEVVERPASVVKEVVENAIDACATAITVEIKNGGMTFIRVTDNGSGIYREDLSEAFQSHATSKIQDESDLDGILTMGFRGEALASIAAVARVELLTRRAEELEGSRYVIEGSEERENQPAGCPKGTTIIIRDLFYNTPARLKFVKKDVSEANAVAGVLDKIAVSHPNIAFQLIKDGELKLNTPGNGDLLSAVYAVYGREFTKGLTEVHYQNGGFAVDGLVSKPEFSRPNRSMQNFFINKRFVKSRTAAAALEEAYKGALMVGRFPACILNLTVEPHTVDVNVHPAKIEVRFQNEKPIFDLVYFGVKNSLAGLNAPEIRLKNQPAAHQPKRESEPQRMSAQEFQRAFGQQKCEPGGTIRAVSPKERATMEGALDKPLTLHKRDDLFRVTPPSAPLYQEKTDVTSSKPLQKETLLPQKKLFNDPPPEEQFGLSAFSETAPVVSQYANARLVGELWDTYILLQNGDKMLVVDKHAAHERILFNRLKAEERDQFCQTLLAPKAVALAREEYDAAVEHLDLLARCGFDAEDFGDGSLLVRTAPMWLSDGDVAPVVSELCANLKENRRDITPEVLDSLYHSVACRTAVKGGNRSTPLELSAIVAVLEEDGTIQHCPHGRPVCVTMTRHELEKQFGRV